MLYNPQDIEKEMLTFWKKQRIFDKFKDKNKGKKAWSFIDGPITANNPMGVHHAWGRTYKDLYQRFRSMQGHDLRFQNGFDCQGLWVEVEVEKQLGFNSKRDIENFGLDNFAKKCRERVDKYSKIQTNQSIRLGQWMDWPNSYYTMSDTNNWYVWYFLKTCHENGWLYKGNDVMPWCLRCGTSLSQHELTDSYKELTHTSVYFKAAIKGKKNHFLLAWSTTPWTFPANVSLAVNPDLTYVEVKKGNETYYMSEATLSKLGGDYLVLDNFSGKKLIGLEYKGQFDHLPVHKGLKYRVVGWDMVGETEGTGIVHIAPGCGKEDHDLGEIEKLPVIAPLNEEGNYVKGFGWLTGRNVKDVGPDIIKDLEKRGILYKTEPITHRYPCCWRCGEELVFRLVSEWFIKTDGIRKRLIGVANNIKWSPSYTKSRQIDWFRNMGDWCISRKRYWGLCLPFWECECGHLEVIGTLDELKKRAKSGLKQLKELHKPWMDKIVISCPKCKKDIHRVKEVGDCWLDAGIVPFSTIKYLEDKEYWKKWFPANFITECAPGQFRGWFYSMLFMSVTLEDQEPFKEIIAYDLVKDEKGEDMHKSKGNAIWFDDAVEKIGADVMRWMYMSQNPATQLLFGYTSAKMVKRNLDIMFNLCNYIKTYCEANDFKNKKPEKFDIASKWLLSRLESVKADVTEYMDGLTPHLAVRSLEDFILNDFSRWYIHAIRDKIKGDYNEWDKQSVLYTMHSVMSDTLKLLAPFIPFVTEKMYQDFFRDSDNKESVHLCDWPKADKKLINKDLEKDMENVKKISEASSALRQEKNIKLRWPVDKISINIGRSLKELESVVKGICNVRGVVWARRISGETKEFDGGSLALGKVLEDEKMVRELSRHVQMLRKQEKLSVGDRIELFVNAGGDIEGKLNKKSEDVMVGTGSSAFYPGQLKHEKGEFVFEGHKIKIGFRKV
jgi:isoleucyl-tRNA synthetase